jgi:hypothetical protein
MSTALSTQYFEFDILYARLALFEEPLSWLAIILIQTFSFQETGRKSLILVSDSSFEGTWPLEMVHYVFA